MLGISIVSVIILLGILIFAHELGHYLMARYTGVGVERFQLGFGPKLIGKQWGETEYRLCLIPLGGLVKLIGEAADEKLTEEQQQRSFLNQPLGKRVLIVAAGPIFNLLLALLIFTVVFMAGVPVLANRVGAVQPGSAAAAGIQPGDRIVAVDGRSIEGWEELAAAIGSSGGKLVHLTITRGAQRLELALQPRLMMVPNIFGEEVPSYKIGIAPAPETFIRRLGPLRACWYSLKETWMITKLTVLSIVKICEGAVSPRTLGGPILIAQLAGTQAKEGIIPFVLFMALLSINLAVLNLLPIPVLDGGHLLFFAIEAITGREVNIRWREAAQQVGFVLLVMLMIFVIMMDIGRLNIKAVQDVSRFFTR